MTKRLDITISTEVPDDMFGQSKIVSAASDSMDSLKTSLTDAIKAAGIAEPKITVTTKVVTPTPGRSRKPKTPTPAPAPQTARTRAA